MTDFETIWPEWHVEELIGQGTYGKVYRISRESMGHVSYAAAKMIDIPQDESEVSALVSMGMDSLSIRAYFENTAQSIINEIAVMESLKGARNVVSIEDYRLTEHVDSIGWTIWIRMELLECLSDFSKSHGDFSTNEAVHMATDICRALVVCHKNGIIHRDVKPANVFRSQFGEYKLGDFGISKRMEISTRSTYSKKGTQNYMAPEIMRGERYNETVDIYSLGIMLYQYLNDMRLPFLPNAPKPVTPDDMDNALISLAMGAKPESPCNADEKLAAIVLRAIEADQSKRYQSALEMLNDLEAWSETSDNNDEEVQVTVPLIMSQTKTIAIKGIRDAGLIERYSGDEDGLVTLQQPDAGTIVERNSVVYFTLGKAVTEPNDPSRKGESPFQEIIQFARSKKLILTVFILVGFLIILTNIIIKGNQSKDEDYSKTTLHYGATAVDNVEKESSKLIYGSSIVIPREEPSDYSWAELAQIADLLVSALQEPSYSYDSVDKICKEYELLDKNGIRRPISKTIELSNGTTIECELVDIGRKEVRCGSSLCFSGLTFMCYGESLTHRYANENGVSWSESELRNWLNSEVLRMLPVELSHSIVLSCKHGGTVIPLSKVMRNRGEEVINSDWHGPDDYLWVPSISEIGGETNWDWLSDPTNKEEYNRLVSSEGDWFTAFANKTGSWTAVIGQNDPLGFESGVPIEAIAKGHSYWLRSIAPTNMRPLIVSDDGELGSASDAEEERHALFCFNLGVPRYDDGRKNNEVATYPDSDDVYT